MVTTCLIFDQNQTSQYIMLNIAPDNHALSVRVDLEYKSFPDKWYISCRDTETGKIYFQNIPLIGSVNAFVDLLGNLRHKHLGSLFCRANVPKPSSPDPGRNNLTEFSIVWGDSVA